jgi:hypothetical protein
LVERRGVQNVAARQDSRQKGQNYVPLVAADSVR